MFYTISNYKPSSSTGFSDDVVTEPGKSYSVRDLMALQQSAVIPDGSMIKMDTYTSDEQLQSGVVSSVNRIGMDLDALAQQMATSDTVADATVSVGQDGSGLPPVDAATAAEQTQQAQQTSGDTTQQSQ